MADNFSVLTSNGTTTAIFRATDVGGGILGMMSIPMDPLGSAIVGQRAIASSISVVLATAFVLPIAAATVPTILTVISTAGAPAAVAIKANAGTLMGVNLYCNHTATPVFLKIYNSTAAGVAIGTTVPIATFGVAPGSVRDVDLTNGGACTTAMSYAITKLVGATDTTAVAINDLNGIITFI